MNLTFVIILQMVGITGSVILFLVRPTAESPSSWLNLLPYVASLVICAGYAFKRLVHWGVTGRRPN